MTTPTTTTTTNQALNDELEAVNSIYDVGTLVIVPSSSSSSSIYDTTNPTLNSDSSSTDTTNTTTTTILSLPTHPFSFLVSFPSTYPDIPPLITGTQSTGPNTRKGEGEYVLGVLRDVLGRVFVPGQVCLFDLIEEGGGLVGEELGVEDDDRDDRGQDGEEGSVDGDGDMSVSSISRLSQLDTLSISDMTTISSFSSTTAASSTTGDVSSITIPKWILSEPLVFNKSTFVARALSVANLKQARDSISHLLATNKKVASATHNITAWRIKQLTQQQQRQLGESKGSTSTPSTSSSTAGTEIVIQDCDDDGETAAGGRLLHLMQLMDAWNVVVVVTRWYGGVKLGPDRFRLINLVAREVLVNGGFAREEENKSKGKGGKKK